MAGRVDLRKLMDLRINEDVLVSQYNARFRSESAQAVKTRLSDVTKLVNGDWTNAYPDGVAMPSKPLVDNSIKNAVYDLSRLAKDARPTFKFVARSDKAEARKAAHLQAGILLSYRHFGRFDRMEQQLYMDLIMAGFMGVCVYYNETSDYPIFKRLDPRYTYPHIRGGELIDVLYTETVRMRDVEAYMADAADELRLSDVDKTCQLIDFYTNQRVVQAILTTKDGTAQEAKILDDWEHGLDTVPVAFRQAESVDGSFHGLMDQAEGPQIAQQMITQYLVDYIESMVHSPFEEKGIVNFDDPPGPATLYHHDPTADESFMRRVAPAAPSGSVFGLAAQLQESLRTETTQPQTRVGSVEQSQASGAFVNSTQGQLTSLVKNLQDMMGDLLVDLNDKAMRVDEKWLDRSKPLVRPVGTKNSYKPSTAIDGWYYHTVTFGAAAGAGQSNADARVLNHLGARLIDRETARSQIDYLDDPSNIEERIQGESIDDAILQKFATDPATPMDALIDIKLQIAEGKDLVEALKSVQARVKEAQQQAAAGAAGLPEGTEQPGPDAAPQTAEEQQFAQEQGSIPSGVKGGTLDIGPLRPLSQVIQRT